MNIQLSEHFTYKKLLRFILPSIIMMVFTSIYSVVDGIFVSNFVGKSAFICRLQYRPVRYDTARLPCICHCIPDHRYQYLRILVLYCTE